MKMLTLSIHGEDGSTQSFGFVESVTLENPNLTGSPTGRVISIVFRDENYYNAFLESWKPLICGYDTDDEGNYFINQFLVPTMCSITIHRSSGVS